VARVVEVNEGGVPGYGVAIVPLMVSDAISPAER
jgi:hypothetical protein